MELWCDHCYVASREVCGLSFRTSIWSAQLCRWRRTPFATFGMRERSAQVAERTEITPPVDTDHWLGRVRYVRQSYPLAVDMTIPVHMLASAMIELAALRKKEEARKRRQRDGKNSKLVRDRKMGA